MYQWVWFSNNDEITTQNQWNAQPALVLLITGGESYANMATAETQASAQFAATSLPVLSQLSFCLYYVIVLIGFHIVLRLGSP